MRQDEVEGAAATSVADTDALFNNIASRTLEDDTPVFVATVVNGDYLRHYYGKCAPEGGSGQ